MPLAAFNAVGEWGESWMYFYLLGFALEMILLALILRHSWTWARTMPSAATARP